MPVPGKAVSIFLSVAPVAAQLVGDLGAGLVVLGAALPPPLLVASVEGVVAPLVLDPVAVGVVVVGLVPVVVAGAFSFATRRVSSPRLFSKRSSVTLFPAPDLSVVFVRNGPEPSQ